MKKWIGGLLAIGLVVAFFAFGRFGCLSGEGWERGWGPMMGPGGGMFMGMIPIIVLIAAVVWWLTKGDKANERGIAIKETPLEILKRRYADGEIAKEQFESMKKVLEG